MPTCPLKLQNPLESGAKVPTCLASPPAPSLTTTYSFQTKLLTARIYPTYGLAVFLSPNILLSWTHAAIICL